MTQQIKPRYKKIAATAVSLACVAMLLAGCGRSDTEGGATVSSDPIDDSAATGTIELWAPTAEAGSLPEIFEQFETDNPEVEINITEIPEGEFASKMTAAISAGTVPDMAYITTDQWAAFLDLGAIAPVPDGLVNQDDFFDVMWDSSVQDEVAYGVPWYAYSETIQYRKDIADKAGLETPTDWEGMRSFLEGLQAEGVAKPLSVPIGWNTFTAQQLNLLSHQNGSALISEDGTSWTINTPENVEALEWWGGLLQDGLSDPDSPTFLDKVPYFTEGKVAAMNNGPWFAGWLDEANGAGWSEDNLGQFLPPPGPAGDSATTVSGANFAVFSDAQNAEASWKLIRYMAQPETQVQWFEIFGNLPANVSAWEDPAIAEDENLALVREGMEIGVTTPIVSTWNEVGNAIGAQMERVARGEATAQEALDQAQTEAESIGTGN